LDSTRSASACWPLAKKISAASMKNAVLLV